MRDLSPDELLLLERARIIEQAMASPFWVVLRDFCQESANAATSMGFLNPDKAALYTGCAKAALDIFTSLSQVPADAAALQRQLAEDATAESEAATEPKPSRRHQPVSHI